VRKSLSTPEKWPSGWNPVVGAKCALILWAPRVHFNKGRVAMYSSVVYRDFVTVT
jgi:hypothetical protein